AELAGEVVGLHQARAADLQVDDRRDRQQLAIAPHGARAGLDRFAGDAGEQVRVVADLQRPEALLTGVAGAEVIGGAALATEQVRSSAELIWPEGGRAGVQGGHNEAPFTL